jgi:hypothetical protein
VEFDWPWTGQYKTDTRAANPEDGEEHMIQTPKPMLARTNTKQESVFLFHHNPKS